MPKQPISKKSSSDRSQIEKFQDAARDLECDDDIERFRERVGKLVRVKAPKNTNTDTDETA